MPGAKCAANTKGKPSLRRVQRQTNWSPKSTPAPWFHWQPWRARYRLTSHPENGSPPRRPEESHHLFSNTDPAPGRSPYQCPTHGPVPNRHGPDNKRPRCCTARQPQAESGWATMTPPAPTFNRLVAANICPMITVFAVLAMVGILWCSPTKNGGTRDFQPAVPVLHCPAKRRPRSHPL